MLFGRQNPSFFEESFDLDKMWKSAEKLIVPLGLKPSLTHLTALMLQLERYLTPHRNNGFEYLFPNEDTVKKPLIIMGNGILKYQETDILAASIYSSVWPLTADQHQAEQSQHKPDFATLEKYKKFAGGKTDLGAAVLIASARAMDDDNHLWEDKSPRALTVNFKPTSPRRFGEFNLLRTTTPMEDGSVVTKFSMFDPAFRVSLMSGQIVGK